MVGPSPLGTLLIQRLDAVLNVPQSQQTNLATGARPDAVRQPDQTPRPEQLQQGLGRHPRETVDRARSQGEQAIQRAIQEGKLDAQQRLLRSATSTSSTPSAPTTLGAAARTILALLNLFPQSAPPLAGRAPLLNSGMGSSASASAGGSKTSSATTGTSSQSGSALAGSTPGRPSIGGAAASAVSGAAAGAGSAGGASASSGTGAPAGSTSADGAQAAAPRSAIPQGPVSAATSASSSPLASNFALALAQTLQGSGLFYESHLNALAFGQLNAGTLRQEPQGQLLHSTSHSDDTSSSQAEARGGAKSAPPGQAAGQSGAPAGAGSSQVLSGLHPETHLLVRQQLEVLANQTVAWRGEAWEGAPLQWEVRRGRDDGQWQDETDQDHWATRLVLHLPQLGEVHARLSLHNDRIAMQLLAPDSAGTLHQHAATLRSQYLKAGLMLEQLSIHEQEPGPINTGSSS